MNEDLPSTSISSEDVSPALLPIEKLFDLDRLPSETYKLAILACYAPIGAIIFVIRFFLALNVFFAACILPKSLKLRRSILRFMCAICGLVVTEVGKRNESCKVIAANHISPLDHSAVSLCHSIIVPNVWNVPNVLSWVFGYADMGASLGRNKLVETSRFWCQNSENPPLFTLPETAMTNGRTGLLAFSSWPFALNTNVQPCALRAYRPSIASVSVCRIGSRWWSDLLWFLFVPYTIITVTWLEPLEVRPNSEVDSNLNSQAAINLSQRCMKTIAADLQITVTKYTAKDAVDYAKRVVLDQHAENEERNRQARQLIATRRRNAEMQKPNFKEKHQNELDSMTFKVKEIITSMPLWIIRKDIEKTMSVSVTIDNLSLSTPASSASPEIYSVDDVTRVYKILSDSYPNERILEKWRMIEEQRLKYMDRCNLEAKE